MPLPLDAFAIRVDQGAVGLVLDAEAEGEVAYAEGGVHREEGAREPEVAELIALVESFEPEGR